MRKRFVSTKEMDPICINFSFSNRGKAWRSRPCSHVKLICSLSRCGTYGVEHYFRMRPLGRPLPGYPPLLGSGQRDRLHIPIIMALVIDLSCCWGHEHTYK